MKKFLFYIIIIMVAIPLQAQTLDEKVASTLVFAEQQILGIIGEIDTSSLNRFPRYIDPSSSWLWINNPDHKWTSGFFPGCLWYMYKHTNDPKWENYARTWTAWLKDIQDISSIYTDQGFIMMPSYGHGYELTKDSTYLPILLRSAESYAKRWKEDAQVFEAWDIREWLKNPDILSGAVDQLMNIDIFFKATKISGDTAFRHIATTYAERLMDNIVREDFRIYQSIRVNAYNGDVVNLGTIQGHSDTTVWSRGQAWGIYGFTMSYRYTKDERFLNTAIGAANYFIDNLPEDFVPYWDFEAPNIPDEPQDASAAAIVCSALLELLEYVDDEEMHLRLRDAAFAILESLASDSYLADPNITNAILLHSVANKPANKRVDVPLIYAEYYFIEALVRYQEYRKSTSVDFYKDTELAAPKNFVLQQNYPNPFNPTTTIKYKTQKKCNIRIVVYSILGSEIKELVHANKSAGSHQVKWNGTNNNGQKVNSGIYFYKLIADDFVAVSKMILIK